MLRKHIPNFLTLLNLLSGCMALLLIMQSEEVGATIFIGFSLIFDFLDGSLARLLKAGSETGKQLDSLADMVSFGVVPGFLMYSIIGDACISAGMTASECGFLSYSAFLIPLFSALRLARFNTDESQQKEFKGLNTPAATIFVASIPIILKYYPDSVWAISIFSKPLFIVLLNLGLSTMLIIPQRMVSLKFHTFSISNNIHILKLTKPQKPLLIWGNYFLKSLWTTR